MALLSRLVKSLPPFSLIFADHSPPDVSAPHTNANSDEQNLSDFWQSAKAADQPLKSFILAHPTSAVLALKAAFKIPWIDARLSTGSEASLIRSRLKRRFFLRAFTLGNSGACVLRIPEDGSRYSEGAHMQTLRRKVRAAEKAGIICQPVEDRLVQLDLVRQLDRAVASKVNPLYRQENRDNSKWVGVGAWTVALSASGEPLVLSITPWSGECALLALFVSYGETSHHSDARYSLSKAVAERLAKEGVRYLVEGHGPSEISNGRRHFQRMIGYRIARIRVN